MTYLALRTRIASLLNNKRAEEHVPTWIEDARSELNRRITHPRMETLAFLQLANGSAPLLDDWLSIENIETAADSRGQLTYVEPTRFDGFADKLATDLAHNYYTIQGRTVFTYPSLGDEGLTVRVRTRLPAFVEDTDTNWLLSDYPDAFAYGAAQHGFFWLKDMEAATASKRQFEMAIQQINEDGNRMTRAPRLQVRPTGAVV